MSVIAEIRIPADEFELGRILGVEEDLRIRLETMVPLGQDPVPFFSVHNHAREGFEEAVRDHPSVTGFQTVSEHEEDTLYSLRWDASRDLVFEEFRELGVQLLEATGGPDNWEFELRFEDHADLSAFQEYCHDAHVHMEVDRIYNPTKPASGPWYGLTPKQRETLVLAFRKGYYSIPRGVSTDTLAAELGISDQAVTERLRRGIHNLIEHTIVVAEEADEEGADDDD